MLKVNKREQRKKMIELKWEEFTGIEKQTGKDITFNEVPGPSRQALQAEGICEHSNLFYSKSYCGGVGNRNKSICKRM